MKHWREIDTIQEWQDALDRSKNQPVIILKHSTACPVSFNALKEYDEYLSKKPNTSAEYLLVKVIESRPVSNQIAEDVNVKHASPQMIMIKNKEAVWNASHWSVTTEHITAVLD